MNSEAKQRALEYLEANWPKHAAIPLASRLTDIMVQYSINHGLNIYDAAHGLLTSSWPKGTHLGMVDSVVDIMMDFKRAEAARKG